MDAAGTDTDAAATHTVLAVATPVEEPTVVWHEATQAEQPAVTLAVEWLAVMPAEHAVDLAVAAHVADLPAGALAAVAVAMAAAVTGKMGLRY